MNVLKTIKNGLIALTLATVAVAGFAAKTTITYIHTDHLGSPVLATKEDGTVKWREDYQPFGQQLTNEDTDNNIGFTGHKDDKGLGLTYMQARWYHPDMGRFMALDPILYRDVHSFNRYVYGNNNPYKYVDPDGRHASQAGFYVHQRATYKVIGSSLSRQENKVLANAHVFADGKQFQTTEMSYRHAMSGKGQSSEQARSMANDFVRSQFEKAWKAGSREEALHEFGVALHTLQDSTSPAHAGFQQWTGEETKLEQTKHAIKELTNPGEGSELYRVTKDAWKWFNEGRLPEGDLFTYGSD